MRLTQFVVLGLSLAACRGDDDGTPGPGPGDDDPQIDAPASGGGSVKVKDVQSDNMPSGTAVTLKGVVVTAVDNFGGRTDDIFVQDLEGGAFSGIKVYRAPLAVRATLQIGDVIDITNAQKDEFLLRNADRTLTELKGANNGEMSIVKTGTAPVPAPHVIDGLALGRMSTDDILAEWEKWEGVLVTVINARQTTDPSSFGADPDQKAFKMSGRANVQSSLVALPAESLFGVCYNKVTGIVDSAFDYLILPRNAADLERGGLACGALTSTIAAVQTTPNAEVANLSNVVVTGVDNIPENKGFWAADAAQAAVNAGVYVYMGKTPSSLPVVGSVLNIRGSVVEFDPTAPGDTLTEISGATITTGTGGPLVPLALEATAAQVSNITTGEPYEGVLVKLANVKVTNIAAGDGRVELTDTTGATFLIAGESFVLPAQTLDTCYASVTGVMSVELTANLRTLNPRSAADFSTVDADCTPVPPLRKK